MSEESELNSKKDPKISVIMAVYNTKEEYLRKAIESILEQTYTDFELIIVNDGSTNNAEEVILSFKDERIKYLKQENKGAASARNNAWDNAKGEYIAIMDSDDVSYSDRLEKQIKYLETNREYSIAGCWANIIPQNRLVKLPKNIKIMDLLADCCIINIMFRKNDLDKFDIRYDENLISAEDYDLYSKAVRHLNISNIQEALFDYRIYPENTSSKKKELMVNNSFYVQDKLLDYLSTDKTIRKKLLDLAYTQKMKKTNFLEQIFSIKNLYKDYTKYKLITILGVEFTVKIREYSTQKTN